ncbi:MAG: protein kinase [Deltaproteobacteria bacterium]|nr:protein kinase [Deltaproteobacteria bacterium]
MGVYHPSPMDCPRCHAALEDSAAACAGCGHELSWGSAADTYPSQSDGAFGHALFRPGALVAGRYDIVEKIGRGGMGVVYRAHDRDLDETVALKIIHPSLISVDETIVERFKHETRVARRLAHPNILKVFDLGSVGDVFYLSMEYLEGTDLKTHLQAHGPMAIDEAIDVACQVCAGLAYAHASGVIHRDVKPHNIFLVDPATRFGSTMLDPGEPPSRWVVKILDFGLAKAIDVTQLSASGQLLGTPVYIAPEQANPKKGVPLDHRADLYSLGIVLYQMFTGEVPFQGATPIETALMHVNEPPAPPRTLRADLPEMIERVILKALAKDRDERYADARQISSDLRGQTRFFAERTPYAAPAVAAREARPRSGEHPPRDFTPSNLTPPAPLPFESDDASGTATALPRGPRRGGGGAWWLAIALLVVGGAGVGWNVFLRPALIRMGYGDVLPGSPVGLPIADARKQARHNVTLIAGGLERLYSGGGFSYTDGAGACPGSKTYSDAGTTIPDLEVRLEGGDYWYTITVLDDDSDGLCDKYAITAAGIRPPASEDPPLTLTSEGNKTGPWDP